MTTKNDSAAAERSVAAERNNIQFAVPAAVNRRGRLGLRALGAGALVAALAFCQVAPLQIIPLAQGYSPDHNVELHLKGPTDVLQIRPGLGFAASGPPGGPFNFTSETFALKNAGATTLNWTLVNTSAWLSVTASGGQLLAGAPAFVPHSCPAGSPPNDRHR